MNIWFTESSAEYTCTDPQCQALIVPGELLVSSNRRNGRQICTDHWHPNCLVAFSRRALEQAQRAVTVTHLALDQEARSKRLRLLRQYASNRQRIALYRRRPPDAALELRIARLLALQRLIYLDIIDVGGPPPTWEKGCA